MGFPELTVAIQLNSTNIYETEITGAVFDWRRQFISHFTTSYKLWILCSYILLLKKPTLFNRWMPPAAAEPHMTTTIKNVHFQT